LTYEHQAGNFSIRKQKLMTLDSITIIIAVFILGLGCGALFVKLNTQKQKKVPKSGDDAEHNLSKPVFQYKFVVAPVALAVLSVVVVLAFSSSLSGQIAYRFDDAGAPRSSMNTFVFILLTVVAQMICALTALGVSKGVIAMGNRMYKNEPPQFQLDGFILLMSNMVIFPQVILSYVMTDAFIYNTWQIHIFSAVHFVVMVIIVASLVICGAFIWLFGRARSALNK